MTLDWTTFTNTIDGKQTTTSETRYSVNPSTKEQNPPVPVSTKADLDAAVAAARKAFKGWSITPWEDRKEALLKFGKAITAEVDGFSKMLVKEQGKPISFTGSGATGKKVMESCSKTLKRVTLELGGKDPAIILPDVDIAQVAPQIALYSFLNTGQICVASKRIYVHADIAKEFIPALVQATKNLKVGDGMEEGVFMGPINNEMQYEKVKGFVEDIRKEGGEIVLGGEEGGKFRYKGGKGETGFFIEPMIIVEPGDDSRIMREEPFGPLLPVATWTTDEEVIARANDTDLGLGASVWGKDMARAEKIAKRLEAGSVWVNEHCQIAQAAPFGGWKGSGLGVENGREGLAGWCNVQSLFMRELKSSL
ncbi:Omega-crystallin [Dactylellina cionopaga]|nr:Omega-crystallin [Dactylellina cionopaga]